MKFSIRELVSLFLGQDADLSRLRGLQERGTRSWRRHPHRNSGPCTGRRAHGIFKDVHPTPSTIRHAEQRMSAYMHSAARKRAFAEAA